MEIKLIQDKNYAKTWDNFIIENSSPAAFLQSWDWGSFKINTQNSINKTQEKKNLFRYAIYNDNNELIAVAQFIKQRLPGGKFYLNCPKGPLVKTQNSINNKQEIFKLLENKIKEICKQEKIVFFRIAPPYSQKNKKTKKQKNTFIKPKILTNLKEPEKTLLLDLQCPEDELLKNMHHKTRYNIRLAEKKNIKIRVGNENDIDIFYDLLKETAKRDKINIFNREYYNKLLLNPYSLLLIAEHDKKPLSAIVVIGFGDTATYLYGASSNEHRNLMPNYLIQWYTIKWAKQNGYKYYDFWGINEKKWTGVTRFKKGFVSNKTGKEINFIGTYDYLLNKTWYNIYKIGKLLRH